MDFFKNRISLNLLLVKFIFTFPKTNTCFYCDLFAFFRGAMSSRKQKIDLGGDGEKTKKSRFDTGPE